MAYFVEDFDTQAEGAVLAWANDDFDASDEWGWCTSWLFDLAGELDQRGEDVPAELGYRAGACGASVSEDRAEGLAEFSVAALIHAALVLNTRAEELKASGLDY